MVSIGPYTQATDYKQMYNIPDLRSRYNKCEPAPDSLINLLVRNDFSKFAYILALAGTPDPKEDCTMFIPTDKSLKNIPEDVFINMDKATALHVVKSSTIDRKIPYEILAQSPASLYVTKDPINKLLITNIRGTMYLNNIINIVHPDIPHAKGYIHATNGLIFPTII